MRRRTRSGSAPRRIGGAGDRDRAAIEDGPPGVLPAFAARRAEALTSSALDDVEAARALAYVQEYDAAYDRLTALLATRPETVDALKLRSEVSAYGFRDVPAALADLDAAIAIDPGDADARERLARLLSEIGRAAEALGAAEAALDLDATRAGAWLLRARLAPTAVAPTEMIEIRRLAEDDARDAADRRRLWNALGRLHDARDDIDAAFAAFTASNQALGGRYDPAEEARAAAASAAAVTPDFLAARRNYGVSSDRSVFIVGLPRSGSTLLDQALSAHPEADSIGETNSARRMEQALGQQPRLAPLSPRDGAFLTAIRRSDADAAGRRYLESVDSLLRGPKPARVVDKSLMNYGRLPLIRLALPQSRALHIFRHPLDCALSCYQQDFLATPFATRLDWLAAHSRTYARTMEAWRTAFAGDPFDQRISHICYEDLVSAFPASAPAMVAAAGLAWHPACARPDENDRLVHTASATQVRRPVTAEAIGKWRRYARHLGPLIEGLGGLDAIDARYQRWRAWTTT